MTVRMAVVIDYQNVHITAAELFLPGRPIEESLIDPFRFAKQLAKARNTDGLHEVEISRVEVFRGIPIPADDPDGYRRNLKQKSQWEYGHRNLVTVTLRPLKYSWEWIDGKETPIRSSRREKGIVLLRLSGLPAQDITTLSLLLQEIPTLLPPLTRHTNYMWQRSRQQSGTTPPTEERSATSKPTHDSGRHP